MSSFDKIKKLGERLYPRGRAFKISDGTPFDFLNQSLAESEARAYNDALAILDSILPDNPNFTPDDATDWEVRLGLITNLLVPFADRKAAIIRKMNHPGKIPARQSHDYLQDSLQLAGFDVYVHENIPEQSIIDVLNASSLATPWGKNKFGTFKFGNVNSIFSGLFECIKFGNNKFGNFRWGKCFYNQKVVSHIETSRDVFFDEGLNFRSTFFIGDAVKGEFTTVDANRKDEFRQLILKIKPVQSVGYLLINYI